MTALLIVVAVVGAIVLLSRSTGTGPRREIEDLEARLRPPDASGSGHGHIERERYDDGEAELEVWVRGLDLPDGAGLEVSVGDRQVATLSVRSGRARHEVRDREESVPAASAGEPVRVRHGGRVVLEGTLRRD